MAKKKTDTTDTLAEKIADSLGTKIATALEKIRDDKKLANDTDWNETLRASFRRVTSATSAAYRLTAQDLLDGKPEAFAALDELYDEWHSDNSIPLFIAARSGVDAPCHTVASDAAGRELPGVSWAMRYHLDRWLERRYEPEQYDHLVRFVPHRVVVVTGHGDRDHVIFTQLRGGEWSRWSPEVSDRELRARADRADQAATERAAQARAAANFRNQINSDPGALLRLAQRLGLADAAGNLKGE